MFLVCLVLVFLVLLQLPKKDAGAGMAFGGAATDALFGAGSGNLLTKVTKYTAGIFFVLAIIMAFLTTQRPKSSAASLAEKLTQSTTPAFTTTNAAETSPAAAPAGGGLMQFSNVPAKGAAAPVQPPASTPAARTNK
jgi:preprotein translocase subunit SecG